MARRISLFLGILTQKILRSAPFAYDARGKQNDDRSEFFNDLLKDTRSLPAKNWVILAAQFETEERICEKRSLFVLC